MHPDREHLQRFLHRELPHSEAGLVRKHVSDCRVCQVLIKVTEREESEMRGLFQQLDHPVIPISGHEIVMRVRQGGWWSRSRWWTRKRMIIAGIVVAIILLALLVPGSPGPRVARAAWSWLAVTPEQAAPTKANVTLHSDSRGIDVTPGSYLVITFSAPQAVGSAILTFADTGAVVVRVDGGDANFTPDINHLIIDNLNSSATYRIQIPRPSPYIDVQIIDRSIFLLKGSQVTSPIPPDASGSYILPLDAR
jgi:hypothetical protein